MTRNSIPAPLLHVLGLSALLTALTGCGSGTGAGSQADHPRINTQSAELPLMDPVSQKDSSTLALQLELVASVSPPVSEGVTLQATGMHFSGTTAYLSYNVAGATQKGGLDQIDVKSSTKPVLQSETIFTDIDANAVTVSGKDIFVAGAQDGVGAVVLKTTLDSKGLLTSTKTVRTVPSFAGTGVYASSSKLYVTSGNTGGVSLFDLATFTLGSTVSLSDARDVAPAASGSNIYVFQGTPGRIQALTSSGGAISSISTGGAATPESKSTISLGKTTSIVSLGEAGMKVVCNSTGATLASLPAVSVQGLTADRTVTNAAVASKGMLFTANGEAGVFVYSFKQNTGTCKGVTLDLLGSISFGKAISANNLYYNSDYLFVASGLGGFKILHITHSDESDDDDDFEGNENTGNNG